MLEYAYYINIFLKNLVKVLFKKININEYIIKFVKIKKLCYEPI